MTNRFEQNLKTKLIGKTGQLKLSKAKVLIVGAGGTGCPVFTYLYYAGVENICVIDKDRVEESNLNRQFLYDEDDIGKYKVNVLLEKYGWNLKFDGKAMTSQMSVVEDSFQRWEGKNELDFDLVIDCTDNIMTKLEIELYCKVKNIPYIMCGVHGYLINVFCWHPKYSKKHYSEIYNCKVIKEDELEKSEGTFPTTTGILGTLVANEALKMILGIHERVIYNKGFHYNVLCSNLYKQEF